jgi:hypothetical protein
MSNVRVLGTGKRTRFATNARDYIVTMFKQLSVNTVNVLVNTINVRNKNGYDVISVLLTAFFCKAPRINRLVVRKFMQKINTINVRSENG